METTKTTIEEIEQRWQGSAEGYYEGISGELTGPKKDAWQSLVLDYAPQKEALDVLDIGTGPGFFPVILGEKGHRVTGIDISENMLAFAKRNAADHGIPSRFYKMDCTRTEFEDDSFDLILSRNLTWTLLDPEGAYTEWKRILRPGGRLMIFDANWNRYLFDEELARKHEENLTRVREKYGYASHDHLDQEDMKAHGRKLPMGRQDRPAWDLEQLIRLGFRKVFADTDISHRIPFSEKELLEYGDETPQFMVVGEL